MRYEGYGIRLGFSFWWRGCFYTIVITLVQHIHVLWNESDSEIDLPP